ncbi:MAG: hypothetical protein P9M08_01875 [Candidatus Erginobacter occultus]|nr:hypothetical protein [Candidatus Erginobacter occultus]
MPLLLFSLSLVLAAVLTPAVRYLALKKGWVAQPSHDRWHQRPTALMGGIAIFVAGAVGLFLLADFDSVGAALFDSGSGVALPSAAAVILPGAAFLFGLGLLDDLRDLKPHIKLIGQILAAAWVVFAGFRLNWFVSLTADTMFTLIWVVGITNAFNLMDNMDGLCAGVGLVACLVLAVIFRPLATEPFLISLVLAGGLAGVLIYNFKPAKIFMGDCGSLAVGFSVSVLALQYSTLPSSTPLGRVAVPLLVLMVPLLDTTLVTVIRLLSGRKASTGGRDHTSHRLVLMGFSERSAVLLLYGTGGVAGLAAIFVSHSDILTSPAVIIPVFVAFLLMGIYLSQLRVYPEKEFSALRGRKFTPILFELTHKRQLMMIALDILLVAFSYYAAYRIRFDSRQFGFYFPVFLESLPIIIAAKLTVFYFSGIYRGFWEYLSTRDVFLYTRSSAIATMVSIALLTVIYRFDDFSKGVFVIDCLLTILLLLGTRGSFRLFWETIRRKSLDGERVAIYGVGRSGELLLRELLNNPHLGVNPVGFLDDNPLKTGKNIQGFPVLGGFDRLPSLAARHKIDGVLLPFDLRNGEAARQAAIRHCRRHGLFLKEFSIDLRSVDLEIPPEPDQSSPSVDD